MKFLSWFAPKYNHESYAACAPMMDKCSGLRTVGDRLANSSISQPTIIANKQGSWLTIIANGPTIHCEQLANNAQD
jgi:hypothetical protein